MMKNQIGFFLSILFSTILLLFMILYFLYVNTIQPATLTGIATIQLEGLEYRSSNGFLDSLVYFEEVQVPVIDLYAGYYNQNIGNIIINQTINDTLYYLNQSTIYYFNFNGNQIGACVNKYPIYYNIYVNGEIERIEVCPPTLLLIYYYNIICSQS
ncbi:MAG: hypothetical protein ACP5GJ_00720 [Nanopusillaceae archaeon]|jgi:hypothetical protein